MMRNKGFGICRIFSRTIFIKLSICLLLLSTAVVAQKSTVIVKDGIVLNGVFEQGGLIIGKVTSGSTVWFDHKLLSVTPGGQFVFGFGRDASDSSQIAWKSPGQIKKNLEILIVKRTYNVQEINGVAKKMVTPKKSQTDRIRSEVELVKKARATMSKSTSFLEHFLPPLEGEITGVYGSQRVFNGTPKRPHYGLDFAAPTGTAVYAPASGVVTLTHKNMYYSGGTLILDHGYGVSSTFIHLSELMVENGQEVKAGELIAKVGSGGRSTGPHLDWRVNWFDVRIDPQFVLDIKHDALLTN